MARDQVTIANLATGYVGEDDQIRSLDEDTKPARTVRAVWDEVRKFVLSKTAWNFAVRRVTLPARPATSDNPIIGFTSAYPLPSGFRRLVAILEPAVCNFQLAGDRDGRPEILADITGALTIAYVQDVENTVYWSDGFTEAFIFRLAWQICDRLSGDKGRKADAQNAFKQALTEAKKLDASQNPPVPFAPSEWTLARRDGVEDLSTGFH